MGRQGSLLETQDDDDMIEVVTRPEQGNLLLLRHETAFSDQILPKLRAIHDKIKRPFAVIGSWPAQQFAQVCRENGENVGPTVDSMVANDIDCFAGEPGR